MSSLRFMPTPLPGNDSESAVPSGGPDPYNQLPHIRPFLNKLEEGVQRWIPGHPTTGPVRSTTQRTLKLAAQGKNMNKVPSIRCQPSKKGR